MTPLTEELIGEIRKNQGFTKQEYVDLLCDEWTAQRRRIAELEAALRLIIESDKEDRIFNRSTRIAHDALETKKPVT